MYKALLVLMLTLAGASSALADRPLRLEAKLVGFNAGGAPIDTMAQGHAKVEIIDDESAIKFRVKVAAIDNLLMAHFHVSSTPVELTDPAGPLAYWFTGGPPPGNNPPGGPRTGDNLTERVNGVLAEGYIITDGDVLDWDPVGTPDSGTVAGLIRAMVEGRVSVVVHTDDLDPNTPTGVAGDSRAGELRGTLEE
ncbi:MAG: CHRD domain-containing protein [Gammaproteobacteria bacterium]|nr:CHRD domain-containing protein [Gammaproteobacteria bacterium]